MTSRNSYLLRKYGITEEDYELLKLTQNDRCYICQKRSLKRALAVDHDHKTKEVRGLLCYRCNHGLLGHAYDSVEMLERALEYLKNPPARAVLKKGEDDDLREL